MKMFKISLCFILLFTLVSCGRNEFLSLYAFIDSFNKVSVQHISESDLYFENPKSNHYTAILGNPQEEIALEFICKDQVNIDEIRISLAKNSTVPTQEHTKNFLEIFKSTAYIFCGYDENKTNEIISAFNLNTNDTFLKEGELTLKIDNFYFVYYSTKIISQVMIYNTFLHKIEETEKPVSKPYYAEDFILKDKETP